MLQCQTCKSWNEDGAAFCTQCGQSVGGGRRRWGLRHTLVLIAGLAGIQAAVFFYFFQQPVEPGVPQGQGQPRSVAVMKPAVEGETPAPPPAREGKPILSRKKPGPAAKAPSSPPTVRRVKVDSALAILELFDKSGQFARIAQAVVVHPDGVVLTRYSPLLGAYKVRCRREGVAGSIPVTGIIRYNQPSNLALLRLARPGQKLAALEIITRSTADGLANEDEINIFDGPGGRPARIAEAFFSTADGHLGILLADSPGIDEESFLAVSKAGEVIGLCRPMVGNVVGLPRRTIPARPQGLRVFIDPVSVFLREFLVEPVSSTVADNTMRIYEGTFDDLEARARESYRTKRWGEAIELLRKAIERGNVENVEVVRLDRLFDFLRESYLGEIGRLQDRRRFEEAAEMARRGLEFFARDGILWFKLAEICAELELTREVIDALLQVRELESSRRIAPMLEGAYHQLARDALKENDGRRAELAYVEGIEQIPDSAILRLHLGQLYQEWAIYQDAIRLLEEAKQLDSALAQQSDVLLGRIDDILSSREAVVIPIPEGAPSISAKVLLDGRMEETFVIDTGATYTAISETLARRLGYAFERGERINVTTAAGRMQVRRIRLVSISLQGYAVHNLRVIVLPDSKGRSLNLLGLNFLNYFKYSVDSTRGEFRLERP